MKSESCKMEREVIKLYDGKCSEGLLFRPIQNSIPYFSAESEYYN